MTERKRRFNFDDDPEGNHSRSVSVENDNYENNSPRAKSEDPDEKKKKRRSRWGGEEKVNIPGLPTILPSTLTSEQQEIYILHLRLEEISRKLRSGEVVPPDNERSPSPEPTYDAQGNRANTREKRYRKKLEEERGRLIELLMRKNPEFKPPADYKKTKATEKVWIPQKEYPEVNFIGQLIGPRGNTLKKMESECGGVKIFIRGKGSIKEGKATTGPVPGEDEELHCMISGDSEEQIKKAVKMINEIIELGKSVPEQQNERKKLQLRELAALNGTLREDEATMVCKNCGEIGHHMRDCTARKNITQTLFCTLCGTGGHLRKDCQYAVNPQLREQNREMDQEYISLMKELGEEIPAGGPPGMRPPGMMQPGGGFPPGMTRPRVPFPGAGYPRAPAPSPYGARPAYPQPWGYPQWGQQASWAPQQYPGAPGWQPLPPPGTAPPPPPGVPGTPTGAPGTAPPPVPGTSNGAQSPPPPPGTAPAAPNPAAAYSAYSGYAYPGYNYAAYGGYAAYGVPPPPTTTSSSPPPPGSPPSTQPPPPPGTAASQPPPPTQPPPPADGKQGEKDDPSQNGQAAAAAASYQGWYDPNYQQYYQQWGNQGWNYQQ